MFMTVAECGSMIKAAERLACSRPVVSRAIAELEATFGVPLLDRTARGIELTQYGLALLARSAAVFDELRQSVIEIETLADPNAGELRLGCLEPLMAGLVSAAIAQLSQKYPRLVFRTETGNATSQLRFLRERKCEVVVTRQLPPPSEPDMREEALFHEKLAIVVGPGGKWPCTDRIALADIVDEAWILAPHEVEPGSPIYEGFRSAALKVPRVNIFSYSLSLRYTLLQTGRFVTAVPRSALHFGPRMPGMRTLPIELPAWHRPTVIMTLKDRSLSPVAKLFIATVRELALLMV